MADVQIYIIFRNPFEKTAYFYTDENGDVEIPHMRSGRAKVIIEMVDKTLSIVLPTMMTILIDSDRNYTVTEN